MGTEKKAGDSEEIQVLEGISESEEIDRRVEELMAPEEDGNGKKKKKKHKTVRRREDFTLSGALRNSAGNVR